MNELTPRRKDLLKRIIESHIATSVPVGSRTLTERYDLHLSPASVRHEMGILEEQGYLTHPHTSAGRLPTDQGYQFFVQEAVKEEPISNELLAYMMQEMEKTIESIKNSDGRHKKKYNKAEKDIKEKLWEEKRKLLKFIVTLPPLPKELYPETLQRIMTI